MIGERSNFMQKCLTLLLRSIRFFSLYTDLFNDHDSSLWAAPWRML